MRTKDEVFGIPYGTRDFLPAEAREKRAIETLLAEGFDVLSQFRFHALASFVVSVRIIADPARIVNALFVLIRNYF